MILPSSNTFFSGVRVENLENLPYYAFFSVGRLGSTTLTKRWNYDRSLSEAEVNKKSISKRKRIHPGASAPPLKRGI